MDYLIWYLVYPYMNKNYYTIYKLVCRDFRDNINQGNVITPHSVLTTKSLLSYSSDILNLVYDRMVKETIIKIGDLESIKYLHTKTDIIFPKFCDPNYTFSAAARNGNLMAMKWLLENGCPFGNFTFCHAAENGNLENMKWLLENGCPFDKATFSDTAGNGNLVNMKWLLENGCPFYKYTFCAAALNGNLVNMKWLLEKGCPFDGMTFDAAAYNGNQDNMDWLLEKGCPQN